MATPAPKAHHVRRDLCTNRPAYRNGRELKAVKVYTVSQESRYLLVQGIPALGLHRDLIKQFALYGAVEEYRLLDSYPAEQFTEVMWVKYVRIQAARVAKRKLDDYEYCGGKLHICYAPEFESVDDTRAKLQDRRKSVARRLRQLAGKDGTLEGSQQLNEKPVGISDNEVMHTDAESHLTLDANTRELSFPTSTLTISQLPPMNQPPPPLPLPPPPPIFLMPPNLPLDAYGFPALPPPPVEVVRIASSMNHFQPAKPGYIAEPVNARSATRHRFNPAQHRPLPAYPRFPHTHHVFNAWQQSFVSSSVLPPGSSSSIAATTSHMARRLSKVDSSNSLAAVSCSHENKMAVDKLAAAMPSNEGGQGGNLPPHGISANKVDHLLTGTINLCTRDLSKPLVVKEYKVSGAVPRFVPRQISKRSSAAEITVKNLPVDPVIEELKRNALVLSAKPQGPSLPENDEQRRKAFVSSETGSLSLDGTVKAIREKISQFSDSGPLAKKPKES